MAVEVRIPTILRPYTGGEKAVDGSGGTLDELFSDLDSRHPGLRERLVEEGQLRRFVNVYLNDEDVRFLGGLATEVADGDDVTILPAVAGGSRWNGEATSERSERGPERDHEQRNGEATSERSERGPERDHEQRNGEATSERRERGPERDHERWNGANEDLSVTTYRAG